MDPTSKIESIKIRGFRSLADVELTDMPNAAVLIGPNGSGKSNFIRFLDMLHFMLRYRELGRYVVQHGGADDQLYGGAAITPRLEAEITWRTLKERVGYRFALVYANTDEFFFDEEGFRFGSDAAAPAEWVDKFGSGHREAKIVSAAQSKQSAGPPASAVRTFLDLFQDRFVYQFNNTSYGSNFQKRWDAEDNNRLLAHGGNLAAVLYRLEQEDVRRYDYICRQIRRVLPNFDRFAIEESYGKVALRWKAIGSDKTIGAHLTSDGSLRFFALATLLSLPPKMLPSIITLDEPELGLHPSAIALLGGMISSLSVHRQVLVATQSPLLVDSFNLDQIFVMDLKDGQTKVSRPKEKELQHWLEEYSTGEMWQKNVLGGRP